MSLSILIRMPSDGIGAELLSIELLSCVEMLRRIDRGSKLFVLFKLMIIAHGLLIFPCVIELFTCGIWGILGC